MVVKLPIRLGIVFLSLLTCSCWATKQVQQVRWHDDTFHLAVSDGGATTSFNWKVTAYYPGFFRTQKQTVFEAYGGPFLTTMQVEGSTLVLLANDGHPQRIELDLQHLDAFLEDPIRYHRATLRYGNTFYQEPAFIKTQREKEQKVDLGTAQRRQQREAGRN